jgi:hypothetical protein
MAKIRLLDRMLGRMSGVETVHIPEVLPPEPFPFPEYSDPCRK